MIVTAIKEEAANMDELVTRRILAEEFIKFEERFEIKMERMIDLKLDEKLEEKFEEKFEQQNRNLGALIEDLNHKMQMLAESIMMQTEASDRKWREHLDLHGLVDKRMARLESEVLIG